MTWRIVKSVDHDQYQNVRSIYSNKYVNDCVSVTDKNLLSLIVATLNKTSPAFFIDNRQTKVAFF